MLDVRNNLRGVSRYERQLRISGMTQKYLNLIIIANIYGYFLDTGHCVIALHA